MRRNVCRPGFSLVGLSLLCFTPLLAQAPPGSDAGKLKNPVRSTPQSIGVGRELYQKNCRSCHGADGKGKGTMAPKDSPPPDLTDARWTKGSSDGEIYVVVRDGAGAQSAMRGYKSRLTETEMWSVVNYIRSLDPLGTR
jgi:mono/diheme cytochrome c family protein